MAKRTYGGISESVSVNPTSITSSKPSEENSGVTESVAKVKPKKKLTKGLGIVIAVVFGALIIIMASFITYRSMDVGYGADSSDEAAVGYVEAIASDDNNSLQKYMPPQARRTGYMANNYDIMSLQTLDEKYDIALNDVRAVTDSVKIDTSLLVEGFKKVYDTNINIKAAHKMDVSAVLSYNFDGKTVTDDILFNIICIQVGSKWYVYTGDLSNIFPNIESVDNTIITTITPDADSESSTATTEPKTTEITATTEEATVQTETTPTTEAVLSYKEPIVKDRLPITKYDGVLTDLQSGHVRIDDIEYIFPVEYKAMTSLYMLVDKAIDEDVRTIKPNFILKNLPVAFKNNDYSKCEFYLSIANASDENIDVADGLVTTFMIGVPKSKYEYQIYDYPDVYLPGNITFGCTYDEVTSVYGELETVSVDAVSSVVNIYAKDVDVYQVKLNDNKHNFIYLQFVNHELVAIQWYFYDLNEFS